MRCPDVYHLADDSPLWGDLRRLGDLDAVLGWLHPRPLRWVLHRRGVEVEEACCLNLASLSTVEEACALLPPGPVDAPGELVVLAQPTAERWYPVLDRSLCVNCGHCLQFCIFGVYSRDEAGDVYTAEPDNCKPGCPACARICPSGAIVFPLCQSEPAIAGAPGEHVVMDAAARRMYYDRTGARCPVCGQEGQIVDDDASLACPECSRPAGSSGQPEPPVFAEIDALIDQLDQMSGDLPQ